MHAVSVRDAYSQFQKLGAEVVLISMHQVDEVVQFKAKYNLPYPCLSDASKQAYAAFHLPRGNLASLVGPSVWGKGWQAFRQYGAGRITADSYQMPGSFVVDTNGIICLAHRSANSADWSTPEELLEAIRDCSTKSVV